MNGILADVNIEGYVDILVARMSANPWKLFWDHLSLQYYRFADFGLLGTAPDDEVWQVCQDHAVALITDNRNDDGADSLESTIRLRNSPACLPVFTVSDVQRLKRDRAYGDRVVESLLVYLLNVDSLSEITTLHSLCLPRPQSAASIPPATASSFAPRSGKRPR